MRIISQDHTKDIPYEISTVTYEEHERWFNGQYRKYYTIYANDLEIAEYNSHEECTAAINSLHKAYETIIYKKNRCIAGDEIQYSLYYQMP